MFLKGRRARIVTKQDLKHPYAVLGTVHGYAIVTVTRGCSNALKFSPEALQKAEKAMIDAASELNADAIIGAEFVHRFARVEGCGSTGTPANEVLATGTAVRFIEER